MVAVDDNADIYDPNHTAARKRHTIARMEVTNLVSQMQETLSTIHQTISSLSTAEHDARLDALEQDRDKHIQAIQAAFADESSAISQKRKAERDAILEMRRKEDEERERRRRLEDEEMEARAKKEDEERDKDLRIHTQEVEDKTDALMAQVEEEAMRMLAEAGDRLKVLEERRKDINRRLDEQLQMPLPPPPTRTRRAARAAGNHTETRNMPPLAGAQDSSSKTLGSSSPIEAVNAQQPMSNPPVKAHEDDDTDAESVMDQHHDHALSRQSSTETLPPTTYSPDPADVTLAVPGLNITAHKEVEEAENNALGVMSRSLSLHHNEDEDADAALADMPQLSRVNSRDPSAEQHAQTVVGAGHDDGHVSDSQDDKQERPAGHTRSLTAELAWWEEQQKNGMNIPDIVGEESEGEEEHDGRAELSMPMALELPVSRRPSLADGAKPVAALDLCEVTKGLGAFDQDALPAPLERHVTDGSRRSSLVGDEPSVVVQDMDGSSRRSSLAAEERSTVARDTAHHIADDHEIHQQEVDAEEVHKDSDVLHVDRDADEDEAADLRGHIEPHSSPDPGVQEVGSFSPRASGEPWPLRHDDSPTPDTQDGRDSVTPELTIDTAVIAKAADTTQHPSPTLEQHSQVTANADITSPASTADNNFQTASVATPVSHIEFISKRVHEELDMVESSPVDVVSIGSPCERDSFDGGAHERSYLTADTSVVNDDEHSQQGVKDDDVASEAGSVVSAADDHAISRALDEDSQLQPIELAAASGAAEQGGDNAGNDFVDVHDGRDEISGDEHLEPMSKSLSEELQQDESSEDPETLFEDDPLAVRSHDDTPMPERAVHASAADVEREKDTQEQTDVGQVTQLLLHDQQDLGMVSRAASEVGDHDNDSMSEDELPLGKVESRSLADELATENMREEQSDDEEDGPFNHDGLDERDHEREPTTQVKPEAEAAVPAGDLNQAARLESEGLDHKTGSQEEHSSAPAPKEMESDDEQVHEAHSSAMVESHHEPVSSVDSNLDPSQAGYFHDHDVVSVPTQVSGPASEHEDSDDETDGNALQVEQSVEGSEQTQTVHEANSEEESTLPLPTGLTEENSQAFFTPLESAGLHSTDTAGQLYDDCLHSHGSNAQLAESVEGAPYDAEHTAHRKQHIDDLDDHNTPPVVETPVVDLHKTQESEAGDKSDTEVAKLAGPHTTAENHRGPVAEKLDQDDDVVVDEETPKDDALKRVASTESFEQDSNAGYESPHRKHESENRYSATVHGQDYLSDDDNESSARGEDEDDRDSTSDGLEKDVRPTNQVKGSSHVGHEEGSERDGQLEDGKDAQQVEAGSPVMDAHVQHDQASKVEEDKPKTPIVARAMAVGEESASKKMNHVAEGLDSAAGEDHIQHSEESAVPTSLPVGHGHDVHETEETTGPHYDDDQDSEHEEDVTEIAASYLSSPRAGNDDEATPHQTELAEPVSPTAARRLAVSRHKPERPQTPDGQTQSEEISAGDLAAHESSPSQTQIPAVTGTTVHGPINPENDTDMESFTPRDVTNISWSESQSRLRSHTNETALSQETAPDLDVESTPMSQRSVSTLSSAPSSPVHASLLSDNHEPVIRDSWPNPASAGGLSSFMGMGGGGSSTGGRARGESNLSNVSYSEDYVAQDGYGGGKPQTGSGGLGPSPMRLWQRREQHGSSTGGDYTGAGYQRPVSAMDLSSTSNTNAEEEPAGVTPTTSSYRNSVPNTSGATAASVPGSGGGGAGTSLFQRMRSVFENNSSAPAAGGASPTVRSRPGSWYSRASVGVGAADQTPKDKTDVPSYDNSYGGQDSRGTAQDTGADKSSWYHENSRRREHSGRQRGGYDDMDVSDEEDDSDEDASLLSEENGHSYDERGYHRYDRHGRLTAGN